MTGILRRSLAVLVILVLVPVAATAAMTGKLKATDPDDLAILPYATPHRIELDLDNKALTLAEIEHASTFEVRSKAAGKTIRIQVDRASFRGFEDPDGQKRYKKVALWGPFRPDVDYEVIVRLPGAEREQSVEVKKIAESGSSRLMRLGDRVRLEFDPSVGDSADRLGLNFSADATLIRRIRKVGDLESPLAWSFKFATEGEVSTQKGRDFQNSLKVGGAFDLMFNYRRIVDVGVGSVSDRRAYAYPLGFRIKPFEVEASRSFNEIDATFKAIGVAAVPYSDVPILWWLKSAGVNRAFLPMTVSLGYTFAGKIADGSRSQDMTNRMDFELLYKFPVSNKIDFDLAWQSFTNFDSFEDYLRVGTTIFFNEARTTGIQLSYQRGALPPKFEDTQSVRLGFSLNFL